MLRAALEVRGCDAGQILSASMLSPRQDALQSTPSNLAVVTDKSVDRSLEECHNASADNVETVSTTPFGKFLKRRRISSQKHVES